MKLRDPNVYEKILLVLGILVLMIGFSFIQKVSAVIGFGWELLFLIFAWLILVTLIIILSAAENIKEELKMVAENQLGELKLLRKELKGKKR